MIETEKRAQILATIAQILTDQVGAEAPFVLTEETDVRALFTPLAEPGDASLDSLDLIEVMMAIEDHFHIEIDDASVESARSGHDFVNLVHARICG